MEKLMNNEYVEEEIDEDDLLDEDSAMEVSLVTGFEAIAPIEIANTEADLEVEMATFTVVPEFYLVDVDIKAPPIAKYPDTKPTMKKKVQSSPSMLEFGLTEQILGKGLQSPMDKDKVKSKGSNVGPGPVANHTHPHPHPSKGSPS